MLEKLDPNSDARDHAQIWLKIIPMPMGPISQECKRASLALLLFISSIHESTPCQDARKDHFGHWKENYIQNPDALLSGFPVALR